MYRGSWKPRRGSRFIPGQFIAILKKKITHAPAADTEPDIRTAADYEALRHLMIEGGEIQNNIERELTIFIMYGASAWIRLNQDGHDTEQAKWAKPCQRYFAGNLAVLLANMMES